MDSIDKSLNLKNTHTQKIFRIRRINLDLSYFPLDSMQETFEAGKDFLIEQDKYHTNVGEENYEHNSNAIQMADEAIKIIKRKKTEAIVIEDDGIGLSGESRFDDNKGKSLIINQNQTSKGDDNRGSFGIGKNTAFQASNLFTVYYLNSFNEKKSFIGHTKFWSYKIDGTDYSPECFTGKKVKKKSTIGDDFPGDWIDIEDGDAISKLRSLNCDGLTTIIPTNELRDNKNWVEDLIYIYAESFSDLIIETGFKIEIIDEITGKSVVINRNTISKYINEITTHFIENDEDKADTLTYLTKYICTDEPIDSKVFTINHGEVSGTIQINLYKMDGLGINSSQPFRFIRGGMMIRGYKMPTGGHLRSRDYGGTIKFIGKKNAWANIFKNFENPNHDSLNTSKIIPGYDWRIFRDNFIKRVNQEIRLLVGTYIENTLSEVEIEFSLGKSINEESKVKLPESASRKPVFVIKSAQKNSNKGIYLDGTDIEGGGKGLRGGDGKTNSKGGDFGDGDDKGKGTGSGKTKSSTKIINIKSKLIDKKNITHTYSIEVNDFDYTSTNRIYISQFSLKNQAILSYKIINITIDNKKLKSSEFTPHQNGNELKYYTTDYIPKKESFNITITVKEPRNTITSFKLSTFEKY